MQQESRWEKHENNIEEQGFNYGNIRVIHKNPEYEQNKAHEATAAKKKTKRKENQENRKMKTSKTIRHDSRNSKMPVYSIFTE